MRLFPSLAVFCASMTPIVSSAAQVVLEPARLVDSASAGIVSAPVSGDFNGDGFPDVAVVAGAFVYSLSVYSGDGEGNFSLSFTLPTGPARYLAAADLNSDGQLDLVVGERVYFGVGDGTFVLGAALPGTSLILPATGDLNGDAIPDLVVIEPGPPFTFDATVRVLIGQGAGSFAETQTQPTTSTIASTELLDVNGDGLDDLLSLRFFSGALDVDFGTAAGTLSSGPVTFLGSTTVNQHVTGDFNEDGLVDVAVSSSGDVDGVLVLIGQGDGTFSGPVVYPFGDEVVGLAAVDLDLDGHQDLAAFSSGTDELGVFAGTGDGTFTLDVILSQVGENGLKQPQVGLFDGDAFPDLVVVSQPPSVTEPFELEFVRNHTYGPLSPYVDLGGELAGQAGFPVLLADGSLTAGTPFDWSMHQAQPGALAWIVFGFSLLDAPFKTGVLKPTPDALVGPLFVDGSGQVPLVGTTPAFGAGFDIFVQYWIEDAGGPAGYAASAGLRASVPAP